MKHDYTKLDAAILKRIGMSATPTSFTALQSGSVREESEALAAVTNAARNPWEHQQARRLVDRRLQALRKAGRIRYQRKPEGWVLAPA